MFDTLPDSALSAADLTTVGVSGVLAAGLVVLLPWLLYPSVAGRTRGWHALACVPPAVVLGFIVSLQGDIGLTTTMVLVVLAATSPILAITDIRLHRLPDRIVLPALAIVTGITGIDLLVGQWRPAMDGLICAVLVAVIGLAGHLVPGSSLGRGDAKLAVLLALVLGRLGYQTCLTGFVAGLLIAVCGALILLVAGKARMRTMVPLGPSLLAGAWVAILVS